MNLLENKNILVAVTGSIAVYKTLELIRLYKKAGANVKVIMTSSSKKFISPLTFETISQNTILDDTNEDWSTDTINNHIAIGKWANLFVLAPATANTINKLSNGIADNILLQVALAYPGIKLLCPAANTNMMHNPLTKASLKMLKLCNFKMIDTTTKELACKDIGDGAMAEVENIFHTSCQELLQDKYWKDRKVVLNGGGTIEKIDDIRYLSNFSSGKMANSLATALYYKGADVCLVTTKHTENIPSEIHTIKVQSATEMLDFVNDAISIAKKGKLSSATLMDNSNIELIRKTPFFFGVAAVSDYTPKFPQNGKIKKDDIGDNWELSLKKNTDILSSIKKDEIITIGFKAEMDKSKAKENAQNMLVSKNIDAVCLNILDDKNNFGSDKNSIELFTQNSTKTNSWNNLDKLTLSLNILNQLAQEFHD
ncbi:MAG: bifunctional phosphopantothenoylcysteine decarboxylase/phosphopantothenate--cysteine ligase CoaBC [Campylobacteraceae bacterium]|jgi:phosphopantothenoylcysteine decarboxylase/phosphopantothenate--cysteine ligase|nr:bifunctional phosphopantothenoylcysteine decarboxylase/phosphopantothenate--cysteine ligase CoaBC [Campylobacteraceae bacterium]MBT4573053.1 bifunctional phosphopantothenoylcysteine decarboxylase/phosphopantothenate--cysteine ligase CoaBC [Campylobacteraceae bacterium]MBT4707946.1 bifunctional phosphopantothenoylcysteine decarboxylase/phosphopantothenate--cysteine ligase CoaBC [Campylobacteraceae bacterium]MBT5323968.1 bifunctional phosphopantothenoylcysteine decarboxylase/phosphopantothenate